MSWLTQSVTGKLSQISGQLKDILTESSEDIVDPVAENKALNERLKEKDRHIEVLKLEAQRWQEESNELALKCKTYEAQLEQKQNEFKQILSQKDTQLSDLQKQLSLHQTTRTPAVNLIDSGFQKSALMEEFEEIPQSEFSEYIHLQKELKRLNEDNIHLLSENRQLFSRIRALEESCASSSTSQPSQTQLELENTIANLRQEIFSLTVGNDKHQEELIAIQHNYTERIRSLTNELEQLRNTNKETASKASSNKSDDGDEMNIDLIEAKSEERQIESPVVIEDKNEEISNLRKQIEMLETELDQANETIQKLKKSSPRPGGRQQTVSEKTTHSTQTETYHEKNLKHKSELEALATQIESLRKENDLANERIQNILSETKLSENSLKQTNSEQEKQIDSLNLELKQLQLQINQEKLIQLKQQQEERVELERLITENTDLKLKIDDKSSEVRSLHKQINELNMSLNTLRTVDLNLNSELEQKSNLFSVEVQAANEKIAQLEAEKERLNEQRKQFEFVLEEKTREASQLKNDVQKHLQHIAAQSKALDKLQSELKTSGSVKTETDSQTESTNSEMPADEEVAFLKQQYNEIYSYLEQKNQESLSYYNEIQRLNVVVSDLNRELQNAKNYNENLNEQYENLVKEFNIEQKMVEDLNQHIEDLNKTILCGDNFKLDSQDSNDEELRHSFEIKTEVEENLAQSTNESDEKNRQIIEQMQFQIDQLIKEKEELIEQHIINLSELNSKLDAKNQVAVDQLNVKINELTNEKNRLISELNSKLSESSQLAEHLRGQINQLAEEKELIRNESQKSINELGLKLNETISYYDNQLKQLSDSSSKDTHRNQQMNKELERLREHLVEMSDNYTKEAIQAEEREKQLRLALIEAQKKLEQFDADVEVSSKELEQKSNSLTQANQELKNERDKLKEKLKKTEESLSHQTKVTKNLELVLERLQNEKDSQHSIEITKYQQTVKENNNIIQNLKKEALCYQDEINCLKESLEAASLLEMELNKRDEFMKQLNAQIGTKDALIESLEKRVNETQKVNDSYIEKEIIKSLVIGYIKVNQAQERKQVLKLISTMLNFTQNELDQCESAGESKWFGLMKASPQTAKTSQAKSSGADKSFTELFIQYVDRESKPRPNLAFDLNNPSSTNKKTDSPEKSISGASSSSLLANQNSASAVRFFNQSLLATNTDLNLINRNQPSEAASTVAKNDPANAFLEQILK